MKTLKNKFTLLILITMAFLGVQAQQNALKMHSGNIIPSRFKIQYERRLNDKFSTGMIGSVFINNFKGYRLEPYGRFYVGNNASVFDGMFFQLKGHYTYVTDNSPMKEITKEYGASMCVGYQTSFASGITAEFFIGSRSSKRTYKTVSESAELFKIFYCLPVDMGLSIGYAF